MSDFKFRFLIFAFIFFLNLTFTTSYINADDNIVRSRNIVVTPYRNFLNNSNISGSTSVILQED